MMKHILILLLCVFVFTSCKNETKSETTTIGADGPEKTEKQSDGLTLLKGEFIYFADAAVLQVGNSVYGVVIDDKMQELYKMGASHRKESTDGIMAEIRGKIIPKPEAEEGWPYRVEIKEIINVKKLDPKQNEVVKIGQ
ncbi:hypothetical protein [uncultured Lacinutrix sp.]|uniref:hypothetical protein n=1 Tax=uncultured Lacinutrix sp. TaxID=574032 RepID=UPI0026164341|nr:hypothetical protein [uncultured Lacinutrix sp.]